MSTPDSRLARNPRDRGPRKRGRGARQARQRKAARYDGGRDSYHNGRRVFVTGDGAPVCGVGHAGQLEGAPRREQHGSDQAAMATGVREDQQVDAAESGGVMNAGRQVTGEVPEVKSESESGDGAPLAPIAGGDEQQAGDGGEMIGEVGAPIRPPPAHGIGTVVANSSSGLSTAVEATTASTVEETGPERRGLAVFMGRMPRRQRETTGVLRIDPPATPAEGPPAVGDLRGSAPSEWLSALAVEVSRANQRAARALQVKVAETIVDERQKVEEAEARARDERRRERRLRRQLVRKAKRPPARETTKTVPATTTQVSAEGGAQDSTCATSGDGGDVTAGSEESMHTEVVQKSAVTGSTVRDQDGEMELPKTEFREALSWSARATEALHNVAVRRTVLEDGFARLALAEAERLETLAGEDVDGEIDPTVGVAQQLMVAASGLKAIAADDWDSVDAAPLTVSRARRRFEKRVRKAKAKEWRTQIAQVAATVCPEGTYIAMDDRQQNGVQRARRLTKEEAQSVKAVLPRAERVLERDARQRSPRSRYSDISSSVYEQQSLRLLGNQGRPACVGKLRAARATTFDLLPTATIEVKGQRRAVKIDTGAQYCVAGASWSALGTRVKDPPPVDYMEGFSGAAVKVLGVWRFHFRTQYLQPMQVDALLVDCDTEDFLIGEDWMYSRGVKIDFTASEMKWYRGDEKVIVRLRGSARWYPSSCRLQR